MRRWWGTAWKQDDGQSLVEYSLILALVAASLFGVLMLFRESAGDTYGRVGNRVDAAGLRGPSGRAGAPLGPDNDEPETGARASPGGRGGGYGKPGKDRGCGGGTGGGLGRGGGAGCGGGHDQ